MRNSCGTSFATGGENAAQFLRDTASQFPKCGGRAPELENRKTLEWMGRFIGRIHAIGALRPFRARPTLNLESVHLAPNRATISSAHGFIPPDLAAAWSSVTAQALEGVRHCYERAGAVLNLRLHGDCHAGNVLWTDSAHAQGPHFVDFDDRAHGSRGCRPVDAALGRARRHGAPACRLLVGYEDFHDFDPRELHLMEALRTLRLIHYSAWIARRWDDPAFPAAFSVVQHTALLAGRILELREQIALDGRAAAVAGITGHSKKFTLHPVLFSSSFFRS